jgi:L-2,4-diaminobutyrate decarboxylase
MFESEFLSPASTAAYRDAIAEAVSTLLSALPSEPYTGKSASELSALFAGGILPSAGAGIREALERARPVIENSIALHHPNSIAHLHCPPLIASLAAEVILTALNQSMDSFDQAPAATALELAVSRWLCDEAGLASGSDAVFTSGGTQSNFMGLLLARDSCIQSRWKWPVAQRGLPAEAKALRILCSRAAHFTVGKSASMLGLGSDAVIKIAPDNSFRMMPDALAVELDRLADSGLVPMAIVATAGTTDFGSIDPLPEIAALAERYGAWLHVDAAYGSALLLSARHRHLLRGLELADSIAMDFHKNFWQAISCGAFLLRDAAKFRHLEVHADYLNPETPDASGIPNLVNKSVATTRGFDALKLWLSFQALGREKFAAMIDRCSELAAHAAREIAARPELEVLHQPQFGCVVFRYRPSRENADADAINSSLRQQLFDQGVAVIGHTRVLGRQCLKFTCMNPMTTEEDITRLVEKIVEHGTLIVGGWPATSCS